MILLKKTRDGRFLFQYGRFEGEELKNVFKRDPDYVRGVYASKAKNELDNDAYYELQAVADGFQEGMSMETLDEFIKRTEEDVFPLNAYVKEKKFKFLYVRRTSRLLGGELAKKVLDIASIEATKPGSGAFKTLIARLRKAHPEMSIFVESVQTPQFQKGLLKMGFMQHRDEPSYYLRAK